MTIAPELYLKSWSATLKDATYIGVVLPVFVDIGTSDVGKYTAARAKNDANSKENKKNPQANKCIADFKLW